ncbi:MAG: hypothetical protein O2958_12865 [Gemmatimonadetes bacterium]|nr:hypothetical protein [Gemmatimonadota bacterium]MDA1103693.1 hypothetical protein [Gemmatimonadota bacterium]
MPTPASVALSRLRARVRVALGVATLGLVAGSVSPDLTAQSDYEGARLVRPAWVVGNVPDTVWVLMEAAVAAGHDDTMKSMLKEAEVHARAATVGYETDIGRRFALAAVLGMRADREGGRTKVGAASALYEELDVVLALDPDHAQARYMMGRLHAGVRRMNRVTRWLATNILGGGTLKKASWEEAEQHLVFAETRAGDVPDHHLQLARLYLDTDRMALAEVEVHHVLALVAVSPMEQEARAEALDLQAEFFGDSDDRMQRKEGG